MLDISVRKLEGILKNYSTIVELEYSNKELIAIDLVLKIKKINYRLYMRVSRQRGRKNTIYFIREKYKLHICGIKLSFIEIPF